MSNLLPFAGRFSPERYASSGLRKISLVVFLHGNCPNAAEHYKDWLLLPAQLARSGYIVVVPHLPLVSSGVIPTEEDNTDVSLVESILQWVRTEWGQQDQVAPPPATGLAGHSFGALLAGRLASRVPALAFVSLSGVWTSWDGLLPHPLSVLNLPALLMWGTPDDGQELHAVLNVNNAFLWNNIPPPKHRLVFANGHHWDYLPVDQIQCKQTPGDCRLIKSLAADFIALFLARYMRPPASSNPPDIPASLEKVEHALTQEQDFFAGAHLTGLSAIGADTECTLTHDWFTATGDSGSITLPGG